MEKRREKFRKDLNHLYLPVYDTLCEMLGPHWQPYYGIRTLEHQEDLWEKSKNLPHNKRLTSAPAGYSPHNYGCASDWCLWDEKGQPIWSLKDKRWNEYIIAIEKAGGTWGGEWGDSVHNELKLKVKWKKIGEIYTNEGFAMASNAIADLIS